MKVYEVTYKWAAGQYPNAEYTEVSRKEIGTLRFSISDDTISWRKYRQLMNAKTHKGDVPPCRTMIVTEDGRTILYPVAEYANARFVPVSSVITVV